MSWSLIFVVSLLGFVLVAGAAAIWAAGRELERRREAARRARYERELRQSEAAQAGHPRHGEQA